MAEGRKFAEERELGPAEMPNFGPPSEPRSAASIVLLRRGGKHAQRALEVLTLKRSAEARFMPSVWVFPGGSVDPADGEGEAGCRVCAVRELAEEAGVELPAEEELVLFSRWITPEVVATRFDARFYLALAPAHTPPEADGVETVEARWFEPRGRSKPPTAARSSSPSRPSASSACSPSTRPPTRRSPPTAKRPLKQSCRRWSELARTPASSSPTTRTTRAEPPLAHLSPT